MSKIGAKILREKRGQRYYSKRPKARVLEDRCQTNSEKLLSASPIVTSKVEEKASPQTTPLFPSTVKEVYLGQEVAESRTCYAPIEYPYARRISAAIILIALVFLFVSGLMDCQSLPRAF